MKKNLKKIISLALASVLALSMSTAVFAEQDLTNYLDKKPVVPKTYTINNGTAPAETFTFSFEGISYVNGDGETVADATIPTIADVTIAFDAISVTDSKTVEANVNVNDYQLGVYTYKVTEKAGNTTGVTYSNEELYLVLTILRDETSGKHYVAAMHYEDAEGTNKSFGFTNQYNSGSLTVGKEITGNMADMSKKFTFTITFTAPADTEIKSEIAKTGTNGTWSDDGLTFTIALGDGETVTLSNIPAGTTYNVTEDAENYTSDKGVFTDTTKTISANDTDSVTFTNTLTNEIDTGISMDSMPYILLLAVVCMGLFVFINKKRKMREF